MEEVGYDGAFTFKYSARPNTPALKLADGIQDEEKARRLQMLNKRQQEIQLRRNQRHLQQIVEAMVEGENQLKQQVIGRTSQNKTVNFTVPAGTQAPQPGQYVEVRVTKGYPNSLAGEMVAAGAERV